MALQAGNAVLWTLPVRRAERVVGGVVVRVLIALDTSDLGESAAAAIAAWSRSLPMEVHVLSVVHPEDLDAREQSSSAAEFPTAEGTEADHIPLMVSGPYGGIVARTGTPRPMTVEYRGQAIERARSEREDYLRGVVLRHFPHANVTVLVEFSDHTAETIVETARALGADAIAMGTHGKSGIRHALVGSVAEEVMRRSSLPVILVGPEAHAARV